MNTRTTTNILLALIAGLLIALVASPVSNSAPKSYDQVKLVEYEQCLSLATGEAYNFTKNFDDGLAFCKSVRPR